VSPAGLVSLTFTITPYKRYRIDFKDRLEDAWAPLGSEQTALTSRITVQDNVGMHQQRFYHVVLVY
jgi:hypothetical protein